MIEKTQKQVDAMPDCIKCGHRANDHRHLALYGDPTMRPFHGCDYPGCEDSDMPCSGYSDKLDVPEEEDEIDVEIRYFISETGDEPTLLKAGYLDTNQSNSVDTMLGLKNRPHFFDNAEKVSALRFKWNEKKNNKLLENVVWHNPLRHPICDWRVGLDVDGLLANFWQQIIDYAAKMGLSEHFPTEWHKFDSWLMDGRFIDIWDAHSMNPDFWLTIPPLELAKQAINTMPGFCPSLYLTARPINSSITSQWIKKHGFPEAKVITVNEYHEKVGVLLKEHPVDIFVDDRPITVREMREAGINAVLYAAPFHVSEDISDLPLITDLSEIINYVGIKDETRKAAN